MSDTEPEALCGACTQREEAVGLVLDRDRASLLRRVVQDEKETNR